MRSQFWPFTEVQNGNQLEVMRKMASARKDLGSRGFYGSVFKQNEMAKNAFGFHKQRFLIELLPSGGRETESRTQSPTHQGACFPAD
ncbi:MAG: hypothetical protein DME89_05620 [Verrucomicrobia bacterium]|nr:MAG: hypothetical protein DME89_05620 [Verrucomicrobiota bacterium]